MNRRRSVLTLLLVAFALAATLGHVCVLPGHVHAAPVTDDHDHGAPADGIHVASCDALRPATVAPAAPVRPAIASIVVLPPTAGTHDGRAVDPPAPTASPPLYLMHRVLLI